MSDWLLSPPDETSWRFSPQEVAEQVCQRWSAAEVRWFADEDAAVGILDIDVPSAGGRATRGTLQRNLQLVSLNGPLAGCAELAAQLRRIVPDQQELIFWDEGYELVIPLPPGVAGPEIVDAVRARST